LIFAPGVSRKIAANHHFYLEWLAYAAYTYAGVRNRKQPVRDDIFRRTKRSGGNLVKNLTFVRDGTREHDVKRRNAVGNNHDHVLVVYSVYVPDFTPVKRSLLRKPEICFFKGVHVADLYVTVSG